MSKRFSKFILFGLVFTLFILSLAILFASCNDDDDKPVEKVFSSDGIVFTLNELWGYYEVTGYNGNADYVLIPSMYQSRIVIKRLYAKGNNNYNVDTLPLRAFKKISAVTYQPTKRFVCGYVEFLREHNWIWISWLVNG